MSVAASIREHFDCASVTAIITRTVLLAYGSASAVDSELYRLVRNNTILRISSGMFMKSSSGFKPPSGWEIVREKARNWRKKLYLGEDLQPPPSNIYLSNGYGSMFESVAGKIHWRTISERKARRLGLVEVSGTPEPEYNNDFQTPTDHKPWSASVAQIRHLEPRDSGNCRSPTAFNKNNTIQHDTSARLSIPKHKMKGQTKTVEARLSQRQRTTLSGRFLCVRRTLISLLRALEHRPTLLLIC